MANEPRPVRESSMVPAWIWTAPEKSLAWRAALRTKVPSPVLVRDCEPSISEVIVRRCAAVSVLMMSSLVRERNVPPEMEVIVPTLRSAMPVPVAVAAELSVKRVGESMLAMVVPAAMPVPVMEAPTAMPAVLVTSTVVRPSVVEPPASVVSVVPAEPVCRMPPEMSLRRPPSGMVTIEEPAALKRRVSGETTLRVVPAKPVESVMFSPLAQREISSRAVAETPTMLPPTAVAKLVLPEASVTVAAAPKVPSRPVKRSFDVVVVMPLTEDCAPVGSTKRTVPARRWVIGPRLTTKFCGAPAVSVTVPEALAWLLRVTTPVTGSMAVMVVRAGMPAPVTGMPTRRPAALATVTLAEPAETTVPSRGKALAVTMPTLE